MCGIDTETLLDIFGCVPVEYMCWQYKEGMSQGISPIALGNIRYVLHYYTINRLLMYKYELVPPVIYIANSLLGWRKLLLSTQTLSLKGDSDVRTRENTCRHRT